jgi:hypothetical protein
MRTAPEPNTLTLNALQGDAAFMQAVTSGLFAVLPLRPDAEMVR